VDPLRALGTSLQRFLYNLPIWNADVRSVETSYKLANVRTKVKEKRKAKTAYYTEIAQIRKRLKHFTKLLVERRQRETTQPMNINEEKSSE
jgi:uncharacterized protein YqjF (DUF2071 family)